VSDCCSPKGYRWIFSESSARIEARRYRRRGLDGTSRRIVDYLVRRGVKGLTLLEIGGGIGAIQIELLKAGAAHAISVELTPTYEQVAAELLRETGLDGRVERTVMDFAAAADEVPAADIVIMNRVICCYPDMPRLAGAAADHTQSVLVMSFPKQRLWTRAFLGGGNLMLWLLRRQFHVFVHPPEQIFEVASRRGLRKELDRPGFFWEVAALGRTA
jgi:hypothetical protein